MCMEQLFEDFEKKIAASGLDKKTRIKSTIKQTVSSPILLPSRVPWPEFKMAENRKGSLAHTEIQKKHSSSGSRIVKRAS